MVKVDLITVSLVQGRRHLSGSMQRNLMDTGKNIGILENDYGAVNVDMMLLRI